MTKPVLHNNKIQRNLIKIIIMRRLIDFLKAIKSSISKSPNLNAKIIEINTCLKTRKVALGSLQKPNMNSRNLPNIRN